MKKTYRKPISRQIDIEQYDIICNSGNYEERLDLITDTNRSDLPVLDDDGNITSESNNYRTTLWGD